MKKRICLILIGLNLLFIWGNSAMPGAVSGALSNWLAHFLGGGVETSAGTGLLRKLAHLSEFASLGFLLTWYAWMQGERGFHLLCIGLLGGLLTACVDESIQLISPDRGPSLVDVWIDTCGVVIGLTALFVIKFKNIPGGNKQ